MHRAKMLTCVCLSLGLWLAGAADLRGQIYNPVRGPSFPRNPVRDVFRGPSLSPYINLLSGEGTGSAYYNRIAPRLQFEEFQRQQQRQSQLVQQRISQIQADRGVAAGDRTGHMAEFQSQFARRSLQQSLGSRAARLTQRRAGRTLGGLPQTGHTVQFNSIGGYFPGR